MHVTLAEELDLQRRETLARVTAIVLLFGVIYLPVFVTLYGKYVEVDSYYSHGFLIPLLSGFVIWWKRDRLKTMTVVPSRAGLWVLGSGLLLHGLGTSWLVNFASALSMLVVLTGLSLSLLGPAVTRALWFPLAYLLYMIPLPKISIIYITFWLKLLVASLATDIVDASGVPVLLDGAYLTLPNGVVEIENACSGLRSLIALTALGAVYAYLTPLSTPRKWILFVASVPLAVAANLVRVVAMVLVSYYFGSRGRAFEWTDFTTGLLVFAIAFLGLYLVSKVLRLWNGRAPTTIVG
jgi:exosortase